MNRHHTFAGLKIVFAAFCIAAMTALPGCSDEPDANPHDPETETPAEDTPDEDAPEEDAPEDDAPEDYDVPPYTVTAVRQYDKNGLAEHVTGSYGSLMGSGSLQSLKSLLAFINTGSRTFHEAVIEYTSVDHQGQPVRLSGIVCYPAEGGKALPMERMVISAHPTITDNASCPSEGGDIAELLTLSTATAVVSADYQGYGISRSALHPYLNEPLTARQQVDLAKAAYHYLLRDDIGAAPASAMTAYSVGYSQGGAVTLAVHRLLEDEEREFADAIGFQGSVCGDGPYNLDRTLDAYIEQGYVTIPVVLPMIVRGMMACYPDIFDGLTLADFFTEDFLSAGGGLTGLLDAKDLNVMQYNTLLGATNPLDAKFPLSAILNPEALSPGSPQMKALAAAAARNNCILGWTPARRVGFFHSTSDTVVPYCNLEDASTAWPSDRYTILHPYTDGSDHLAAALQFYARLLTQGPAKML